MPRRTSWIPGWTRGCFAFDDRLGYLTQCPTNLGTGMRASLMLHLPALQENNALQQLANTVSKLGLTIRGLYGEGRQAGGCHLSALQSSDAGHLRTGCDRKPKGDRGADHPAGAAAREQLAQNPHFEDRAWRSLGLLRTARLLSHDEFMALISNVRVGVAVGIVEGPTLDTIGELINDAQPATLMLREGKELEPLARDAARARMVRERLTAV